MNDVKLQFVGSGDAFGSGGRFQTCLLLFRPPSKILIDCGASSLIALKRLNIDPTEIDAIVVSHLHGDHFGGIPFLILDGQFSRREGPLLIAGPPGIHARVIAAMEVLFPGSSRTVQRYPIDFVDLEEGVATAVCDARVTAFPVEHASGAPAFALRLECDGKIIVYSGDTSPTEHLWAAARGADLFVCEAYSFERRIPFHLDYTTLKEMSVDLACKRIVLTHMSSEVLRRSDITFERADDGLVFDV